MTDNEPTITDFDPAATNEVYAALRSSWELNRDFAEMHLHVLREGTYLDRFGAGGDQGGPADEADAQYAWRRNACVGIDQCADLIHLRVDNLFRTPPVRRYADSPYREIIAEFLAGADGGGTDMTAFMRRVLPMYYINGVDFVVDKQAAPPHAQPRTLAQERQLGLLPYVHAFSPLERLDWACDHAGRYLWARYDLGEVPAADEYADTDALRRYLTVTPHEWRLYDVPADGQAPATVRSGQMALGVCPIVTLYFKESARPEYPKVPLSLLTRIAPIARYLLNLVSQIQIDVYRNIAFLVATGVEAHQIPTEITPMGCWALPEGADLRNVAGDVEHIRVKLQLAQTLMEAILRIGKLTGAAGDIAGRASSAAQVEVERTDLDNEMRMTAGQLEQVETDLVHLAVCRYKGRLIPKRELGYSVEYNKKYVLTPVAELVRQAREFASMGLHSPHGTPGLMKVLLRKILDAVAKEDDPAYAQALAEIDAAVFEAAGAGASHST